MLEVGCRLVEGWWRAGAWPEWLDGTDGHVSAGESDQLQDMESMLWTG